MVLFLTFWKSLIWLKISFGVLFSGRGRNKDHSFTTADLGQFFIGFGRFGSEPMGFIDKNIPVFFNSTTEKIVQFTQ